MAAVRLLALTKDFDIGFWRRRPVAALRGVTLDVAPGEVLGYLGPNGAGKTTTMKLLVQLLFPTSGSAEILGRPAGDVAVRRRVGFLPEAPAFGDNLSAEALLIHYGRLFGFAAPDARRRAARLLDRVGIDAERRRPLRRCSRGMLQRVGVAQALLNDPEVVLLDEPLAGLDALGRRAVRSLLLALREEGRTVLLSSHILSDAEALCSRVAILARGRLAAAGRMADLGLEVRGWELVVAGVTPAQVAAIEPALERVTRAGDGRCVVALPRSRPPEPILAALIRGGARILALDPRHETLEEFFVRTVAGRDTEREAAG